MKYIYTLYLPSFFQSLILFFALSHLVLFLHSKTPVLTSCKSFLSLRDAARVLAEQGANNSSSGFGSNSPQLRLTLRNSS